MTNNITVLYDTIRLEEKLIIESAKKNDISIELVDCKKLFINLNEKNVDFKTVLQRCVSYYRNIHSTASLEGFGINVINCLNTGLLAGNKLFTHMLLQKNNIPTPDVTVAFSKDAAMESLEKTGYPKIIKPTIGSWGRMVSKLNDHDAAEGIIEGKESMHPIHQVHFLEEFVERPPRDIRAIVIGDTVSAASGGTFQGAVGFDGGITGNLDLNTDSAVIKFGADDDVTISKYIDVTIES